MLYQHKPQSKRGEYCQKYYTVRASKSGWLIKTTNGGIMTLSYTKEFPEGTDLNATYKGWCPNGEMLFVFAAAHALESKG